MSREDTERVATDGTIVCGDAKCGDGGRAVVWALDLADGDPVRAHQVTSMNAHRAVTVCGETRGPISHPHGWWQAHPGQLPLQEHAIHCRQAVGGIACG